MPVALSCFLFALACDHKDWPGNTAARVKTDRLGAVLYDLTDLGPAIGEVAMPFRITDDGFILASGYSGQPPVQYVAYEIATGNLTQFTPPTPRTGLATFDQYGNFAGSYDNLGSGDPYWAHAFLFLDGVFTDLGTLGGRDSYAYAFNTAGQVVGDAFVSGPLERHAFFWDGAMQDIGSFGGRGGSARAINSNGAATGALETHQGYGGWTHAFLYGNGTLTDLGTLGACPQVGCADVSEGLALSEAGHVAGTTTTPTGVVAFLWNGEQMLNLGRGTPKALNNLDQVVGTTNNGEMDRAFAWRDGQMIDLNDVVPPSTFLLWHANGINSTGQIVGIGGEYGGLRPRGFLLNPR